ncbi:MAG: ATP-binding cassette domain-containing protein [Firmicutes bacterium]|nr:ATP-binding cassette domain-containing protein [Bacillota bacterium]
MIQAENLVKIYKSTDVEVMALAGLDMTVERGELMAVIGNSGSGKSTLLNMIGGLDRPTMGRLIVDGKDLFKLDEAQLVDYKRKSVGFVWQNNARNLLPYLTASQNVELPMIFDNESERRTRALELLEIVGMEKHKDQKLSQLSGGEQQRIAIAIALANKPSLLLADEPTGSVDVATGSFILNVFRQLNQEQGLTIVIVTHDRLLSRKVNRVVSIRDGKTSSERIMKQSYRDQMARLGHLDAEDAITTSEDTQEEFAILDRAGRIQIPREVIESLGISGNKLKMEIKDGKIVITKPE